MGEGKGDGADLVVVDPLYKFHDGDEISAKDMKVPLKEFDELIARSGAALLYVHHDAKGTAGDRDIRDRGSGSGALARDYDANFTLTPHRDYEDAVVVETLFRNYPPRDKFSIEWQKGVHHFACSDLPPRHANQCLAKTETEPEEPRRLLS